MSSMSTNLIQIEIKPRFQIKIVLISAHFWLGQNTKTARIQIEFDTYK